MRNLITQYRETILGLISFGGSRLLLTGMSFISSMLIARALGAEQLGEFSLITGVFAYVSIFADFGLRSTITAEASRRGNADSVIPIYIKLRLVIATFLYAATLTAVWLFYRQHIQSTALIMLSIFFSALQFDWILIVNRQYQTAGWIAITRGAAYLLLIVASMHFWHLTLDVLALIFLFSWIIAALCSWIAAIRWSRSQLSRNDEPVPDSAQLLKKGGPVLGATLVSQALQNADLLWVGHIFGTSDAGQYYLASSVIGAGLVFANATGQLANSQYATIKDAPISVGEKLKSDIRLLLIITSVVSVVLYVTAPHLVPTIFGNAFSTAGRLILSFLPYLILYHLWSLLFMASIALGLEKKLFRAKLATILLLPGTLATVSILQTLSSLAVAKGLILLPAIALIYFNLPKPTRLITTPTTTFFLAMAGVFTAVSLLH